MISEKLATQIESIIRSLNNAKYESSFRLSYREIETAKKKLDDLIETMTINLESEKK